MCECALYGLQVTSLHHDTPICADKLRVVCISDTHAKHPQRVPVGDILLHAGDFTNVGGAAEVKQFNDFLGMDQYPIHVYVFLNNIMMYIKLQCSFRESKLRSK